MDAISGVIERWRRITAEVHAETGSPHLWKDGPVPHFLHAFRPHGERLPDLFADMPDMAPVLERLRVIFARAGRETGHAYFMVSRPRPMDAGEVRRTARAWMNTAGSIAARLALEVDDDIARFLASESTPVELVEGPSPRNDPTFIQPVEQTVHEAVTGLGRLMTFGNPAADLLEEPLYMLACSHELAFWVLSPLAPETRDDPFAPAAALWEAGVDLQIEGDGAGTHAMAYRRTFEAL